MSRTMNIENAKIAELIDVANTIVLAKQDDPITVVEEAILQQALQGKKLLSIQVGGYSSGVIQRQFAPRLWKRLGDNVGIKNVRLILENAAIKSKQSPSKPEYLDSEAQKPPGLIPESLPDFPKRVPHNLPKQNYTKFIGRQEEVAKLLKLLSPGHAAHLICIAGIGGVGKTSLVVACARLCLHASCTPEAYPDLPTFDTIIFTSAKQQYLTYSGVRNRRDSNQKDIVRQIVEMLDINKLLDRDIAGTSFEEQITLIYKALSNQRTLLIVDNLETVENKQDISDFLYDLPASVKTVITTREGIDGIPIRLTAMPESDGLSLVQYQAGEMGVSLRPEDSQTLYQLTGGLPVAIDYAIGQLAYGYSLQEIQARITHSGCDIARFCFESSVHYLLRRPTYWLLIAMALFPTTTLREALVAVAIPESDSHTAEDAIVQLQTLSLISQEKTSDGRSRYSMLSLTREYVLAELKAHPDFEQEARERWVNWYLSFSQAYSKEDAGAWLGQFEGLDEEWQNLQAVADWCIAEAHYDQVLQIWQNLRPYTYVIGRRINRRRYWNAGLTWTNWLIQTASQRGDWNVATQSMFDCAWILVATGKPKPLEEADILLEQAWDLRQYQDLKYQVNLARYIAVLRIKQQKYVEARTWLRQSEEILQQAELDARKRVEYLSQTRYYQGMNYLKSGEIDTSKSYFEEARNYARSLKLERLVQVIETSLADVAVQQGDLDQAERLLIEGLRIAEANADQCRTAFIKQSFAGLAKARGNISEAQRYATEAFNIFERLGMTAEADEVQAFIDCTIFRRLSE